MPSTPTAPSLPFLPFDKMLIMETASNIRNLGDEARAQLAGLIDLQMSPLGLAALEALCPTDGETVLDVGCGAGETLLQLAQRVGETGRVIGVDIAPRVLDVARSRTAHLPQVRLIQDDATSLPLPDESLDAIFSRFGMMFFADPAKAFSNMRRMLKANGRIGFVCWRPADENELDLLPLHAAGLTTETDAAPFSFGQADKIQDILRSSGFRDIHAIAHDEAVSSGGTEDMLNVVTRVGALGMILRENPALLPKVEAKVRAALAAREIDGYVHLRAATWVVTALAA